jgi:hypothetical protein
MIFLGGFAVIFNWRLFRALSPCHRTPKN